MQLEKIITFTHAKHRLRFLLMERSLRAVGCNLPIWAIPFDEDLFDLPKNSVWWEEAEIINWTKKDNLNNRKRKYQCLTTNNFQYVDTDVVFIQNPEPILQSHHGLVACCNEWTSALHGRIVSPESLKLLKKQSTLWQRNVFCSGQFACDDRLFTPAELITTASHEDYATTCIYPPYGDQEGLNLLVSLAGVNVTNLTLPPFYMESSWAGDYPLDTESYWVNPSRKPYLMHFYGHMDRMHEPRPINRWFHELLTLQEQHQWIEESKVWTKARLEFDELRAAAHKPRRNKLQKLLGRIGRATKVLLRG